jgi:hypothetical protein
MKKEKLKICSLFHKLTPMKIRLLDNRNSDYHKHPNKSIVYLYYKRSNLDSLFHKRKEGQEFK